MSNPEIFEANKTYKVTYADNKGGTQETEFTPSEDLSKAKVISQLRDENKDYLKLLKITESYNKKEESSTMEFKTYKEFVEAGRAADVCDNVYDICVYIDYEPGSTDPYDMCLEKICSELHILDSDLDESLITCDITEYVKNHLDAFDKIFEINGEDEDEKIEEFVCEKFEVLMSGGASEKAYDDLYYALVGESKDEKIEEAKNLEIYADSFESLNNMIEDLYEAEEITDDQYDELCEISSDRQAKFEKYIKERSEVTNTDEADIIVIEEDYVKGAIEAMSEVIGRTEKIEEAKKDIGELVPTLKQMAYEILQSDEMGFPEDEAKDYTVVELKNGEDNSIIVEVRAELSYEGMENLIEYLNPVVKGYDKESYFDMVEPGIAQAVIEGYALSVVEETVEPVEDPMEVVVENLVEEIVQESKEEKIEEAYFNLYKSMDELYGISKYNPSELKNFLNGLNDAQRISEKDFNLLMKYADRHQEIIDECGYESSVLDEAIEEDTPTISKERKAEIIAELFDWIDYHDLDAYEFLNVTEEDLDKSSHMELDEEKMDDIISKGITCVDEHIHDMADKVIGFKDIIGLSDEEIKILEVPVELTEEQPLEESIKDTDFIIYRSTVEGPLYMSGLSTTFNKEQAVKYPTEEEAKEALHNYVENVVDPEANNFKVARLNENKAEEANTIDLSMEIKPWYKEEHKEDGDFWKDIKDGVTFQDVQNALDKGEDVYEVFGVGDSVVRENIFQKLSELRNVDYDVIYNEWLHGGEQISEEELNALKQVFGNIVNKKTESVLVEDEEIVPETEEVIEEPVEVNPDEGFEELEAFENEDMTEVQENVEEAISEVEDPTEEDKLAVNVVNETMDVLIVDETSAINGYREFLNQAKATLLPPLYDVLEKEMQEIINDEEDHIAKLETLKATFHLEDIPLDESKEVKVEAVTLNAVLDELEAGIDSPMAQEDGPKIEEYIKNHPEATLEEVVNAYKNYEETGMFE